MENQINFKTANFIQFSLSQGKTVQEILKNPKVVSEQMGIILDEVEFQQLKSLNENPVKNQLNTLSQDSKDFVKEVLKDGRFVLDWKDKPSQVANEIGIPISPNVENELRSINLEDFLDPNVNPLAGVKIAIISVAIAVVLGSASIGDEHILVHDFSNVEKL